MYISGTNPCETRQKRTWYVSHNRQSPDGIEKKPMEIEKRVGEELIKSHSPNQALQKDITPHIQFKKQAEKR